MTESPLDWADQADEHEPEGRRRQVLALGAVAGVAVVAGGAFLLLHGGSSSSSNDGGLVPGAHHVVAAPAAVTPSAVPTAAVFHGAVGHDPFTVPDRILAALAPPPPATTAASVKTPAGSTITVPLGSTPTSVPATGPSSPTQVSVQWIQLLAAHNVGGHWLVDVRTAAGTFRDVKAGATGVGKTFFSYLGEDGSLAQPSFVFVAGDSAGGNLVPNRKVAAYAGKLSAAISRSTLVLHHGLVDGGVS